MNWLDELLAGVETVAIGGHIRPDGDCVGSCLGLKNYIMENYPVKNVEVFMETPSKVFSYLKGFDDICSDFSTNNQYDIFFALDCGDTERLGDAYRIFENAGKTVCIDHHISNTGYGNVNRIDGAIGSTCEILFDLMEKDKISQARIIRKVYLQICISRSCTGLAGELRRYVYEETFGGTFACFCATAVLCSCRRYG